ncbi:MAG: ROK family transcriptional regulator [Anaerolineales bacterium]|nr:ROK family transcriptional regulator [Anaerolineales bacterium]
MSPTRRKIHTITASEMRQINRSSILEMIRCYGPISRTQVAEDLQASLPTVMRIVEELMAEGLVAEDNEKEWSGGRKRKRVIFNGSQHLVIGIDLGGTKIYGAVADFNGDLLHEIRFDHHETQEEESLDLLCEVIDQLLAFAQTTTLPVRGIGIGVPGVVQPDTGIVSIAPALDWKDYPLKSRLEERYEFPIAIENDVNLAALGEMWFGASDDENNLVLLTIGTGIGAGVIINGAVYSGSHNMAGEVGYFLPDRSFLGQKFPGFGALEQLASGTGIAARARKALLGTRSQKELEALTAYDVFDAVHQGEEWASEVLKDTVAYLAQLIAAIAVIFDPDVIILGGGVSRSADLLIEPICNLLEGSLLKVPNIRASKLGYRAAAMGAIMLLLRVTSNYYLLQKFI